VEKLTKQQRNGVEMRQVLGSIILIFLVPLVMACVIEAFSFLAANFASLLLNWLTYGFVLYLILYIFFLHNRIAFLEVFEHELGHALVAVLFFRKIDFFFASSNLGLVNCPEGGNLPIVLAPYFLPVFTLPLLIIKPFVNATVYQTVDFFLGLTLAFHFAALFKELSPRQPDIHRTGASLSLFAIIPLNAFFTVLTISFAVGMYAYPIDYCKRIFMTTIRTYQFIGQLFLNPSQAGS
jgi:hypothetical protein